MNTEQRTDGGPAFPQPITSTPSDDVIHTGVEGMTLLDWFAGQFVGHLASVTATTIVEATKAGVDEKWIEEIVNTLAQTLACDSYRLAAGMLEERKKYRDCILDKPREMGAPCCP